MARERYIQCRFTGVLYPANEYAVKKSETNTPYIIGDIQPYRSMQTGEMITSRSQHRAHLRQHGLIEVGNEIDALTKPKHRDDRAYMESMRRDVAESIKRLEQGYR